ncbi:hypothetical protein CF319_g8747 [Tilletia indica]|nr:hypothetical protein CF319_g8747 [Tilletia indica]
MLLLTNGRFTALLVFFRGSQLTEVWGRLLIFSQGHYPLLTSLVFSKTGSTLASPIDRALSRIQMLSSIESLAGVDVLCSDKTDTLTDNKLPIHDSFTSEGVGFYYMMAVAALLSSHSVKFLDPIDKFTIATLKDYPGA